MSIVVDTLGKNGLLAQALPGFKYRDQQMQFAAKTARSLLYGGVLLAECPPGVGKSFGYCVPLIGMNAKTPVVERTKVVQAPNGKWESVKVKDHYRGLIVTANIALQEQLVEKDLPLLQKTMPYLFDFKLAKGRGNYVCYDFVHSSAAAQVEMFDKGAATELKQLVDWARKTKTGDMNELDFVPNRQAWAELTKQAGECKGKRCKSYSECFVQKARAGMKRAHIIVCNYHLFFSHLAYGSTIIPDYDSVILDEAHEAVDIARDIMGWRVSHYAIKRAAAPLRLIGQGNTRASLLRASSDFFENLRGFRESPDYRARLKKRNVVDPGFLFRQMKAADQAFALAAETAKSAEREHELYLWSEKLSELQQRIAEALTLKDESCVYFIEVDKWKNAALQCKTINVSGALEIKLFSKTDSIVLTSATLAVAGKMQHLVYDLGITRKDVEQAIVGSPFNIVKQSVFIVPRNCPSPDNAEGVANMVEECISLAGGRTLCLFTSYKNLAVTRDRLRERTSWNVLAQGDKPRTKLVEEFRKDVKSVLLGVESFWAGIDVPGEALSCLIIDRLPFPTPDDPVLDATKDKGDNWFIGYSIPRAVTTFRQGIGRLIRSVDDRGVVVVLDDRIIHKRYGSLFTRNLPRRMQISKNLGDIQSFLGR